MKLLLILLSILTVSSSAVFGEITLENWQPLVRTLKPKQVLRGTVHHSRDGAPYYAFRGVRYANRPERFEIPTHLSPTPGNDNEAVVDAIEFGPSCARWCRWQKRHVGSEDCLYANIFVPKKDEIQKKDAGGPLPVMLWIHGGGFVEGESETFGPEYFMDEDVILVTINYRLGALGFLSTGDAVVPGNLGLHDQAVAIDWVHHNIASFGGDKSRVIIFGESAGAGSVGAHLLYPPNAGKFAGAISQSGSVHCAWMPQAPEVARSHLGLLSKEVGCDPAAESANLIACLKSKPWENIIDAQRKAIGFGVAFAPVVEPKQSVKPSFLTEHPHYLMNMSKFLNVPYILGLVEEEGHFFQAAYTLLKKEVAAELNSKFESIAPKRLFYQHQLKDPATSALVASKIWEFYFGDKEISEETRQQLTDMDSDAYFDYGVHKTAQVMKNEGGQVYTYVFTYKGEFTVLKPWLGIQNLRVVTHTDELQYLFLTPETNGPYGPTGGHPPGSESERISKNLVKLWASFARTGSPTSTWGNATHWHPLSKHKDFWWYQLDSETRLLEGWHKARFEFWDELRKEYFINHGERAVKKSKKTAEQPNPKDEL